MVYTCQILFFVKLASLPAILTDKMEIGAALGVFGAHLWISLLRATSNRLNQQTRRAKLGLLFSRRIDLVRKSYQIPVKRFLKLIFWRQKESEIRETLTKHYLGCLHATSVLLQWLRMSFLRSVKGSALSQRTQRAFRELPSPSIDAY